MRTTVNALPYQSFYDNRYGKVEHTQELAQRLKQNFDKQATGYPIPVYKNHNRDAGKLGEVLALEVTDKGLVATLDVEEEFQNQKFDFVSPAYVEEYTDKKTGAKIGPTLLEISFTNQPGQPGMEKVLFADEVQATIINNLFGGDVMEDKLIRKYEEELADNAKRFAEQLANKEKQIKQFEEELAAKEQTVKQFEDELAALKTAKHAQDVEMWKQDWISNKRRPPAIVNKFADKLLENAEMREFLDGALETVEAIPEGQKVALEDERPTDASKAWAELGTKLGGGK